MASNWMRAKLSKLKAERREAGVHAGQCSTYELVHFKPQSKAEARVEAARLCQGVPVKRIPCTGKMPREAYSVTGKQRAQASKATYGDYSRQATLRRGLCG